MPSITVKLTELQVGEIAHKVQIVAEEADLQESYEISADEAQALADYFNAAKAGFVTFDEIYRDLVTEEIEDRMSALHSNWKDRGDESDGGMYRSMAQALKRVKTAVAQ